MVSPRTGSTASHRTAALLAITVLAASILTVLTPSAHGAPAVDLTEFTLPVDGSSPFGITTGPDGALWFSERATDSIGTLATEGTFGASTALAMTSDPTAITSGPDGALWFTEQGSGLIGRLTTDGALTEFFLPSDGAGPAGIVTGPDGALWFTERQGHRVARIATDGTAVEFELPTPLAGPMGIALGSDGNLWFTEQRANQIGRITTDGIVTEYPIPVASSLPTAIATGPDGALWFTMRAANRIGRVDTVGNVTTFPIPTAATDPTGIAVGWDGALWFTEPDTDAIGRITTGGAITEFPLPNVGSSPFGITGGPDDAVWFTEGNGNRIGRLTATAAPTDTTAPTITITTPRNGSVFTQGQPVAARYGCADEPGGSGLASCDGPVVDGTTIDTSIGAHRFDVHASDVQGNTSTASTGYLVFADLGGTVATPTGRRAGFWETLDLGLGLARPADPQQFVAPGFPVSQQVDCADPSQTVGVPEPADVKLQIKQGGLDVRWRTERAWTDTCRTFTLRFTTPGWTGADAIFFVPFVTAQPKRPHK